MDPRLPSLEALNGRVTPSRRMDCRIERWVRRARFHVTHRMMFPLARRRRTAASFAIIPLYVQP